MPRINFAHLRERSTTGGWISFAVFDARSNSSNDRDAVLYQLTMSARENGLRVDKSALAFRENGRNMFYGDKDLVNYLSKRGVPAWTHHLDV
jgi:hypothetical protein